MKQLLCLLLTIVILLSLCACEGNWNKVNLQDPVQLPQDGTVTKDTIQQIKTENAIAVFTGAYGDFTYEWTVFGSAIRNINGVNLGVTLEETTEGNIRVTLNQTEHFGFSATLAIHLNKQWNAENATACAEDDGFAKVSVTGSKHTILNVNLDGTVREFVICPDQLLNVPAPTEPAGPTDVTDATTAPTLPTESTTPTEPEATTGTAPTEPTQPAAPTQSTEPEATAPPAIDPTEPTKDQYLTDPVPEGKPNPVEPEDQEIDQSILYTCTFSIECSTILNNLDMLDPDKLEMVPSDGVILAEITVTFYEGESVFDVLQRVCKDNGIHMEAEWTPIYNSAYIEGIHNLYEFDCGALSGWMYRVNGWYPNYGCSRYQLQDGDVVEWRYTCDLGNDVGGGYAIGG